MTYVWCLLLGAGMGFAVSWWGMWYRLAKIESDLRHIANAARAYEEFSGETVPRDWLADQLEWLVHRNF